MPNCEKCKNHHCCMVGQAVSVSECDNHKGMTEPHKGKAVKYPPSAKKVSLR